MVTTRAQRHQTDSPPVANEVVLVDGKESQRRVDELGEKIRRFWPEDKMEFLTDTSVARIVDSYYRHGLPKSETPVKLLILSESPCFTRGDIAEMKVDVDVLAAAGIAHDGPVEHVNLVHCLTYGEAWAIQESTIAPSTEDKKRQYSAGTWPFWKVLLTFAGMADVHEDGYDPLESDETVKTAFKAVIGGGSANQKKRAARIQAKHDVLKELREKGIVLIDVSPFAVYLGGGTVMCTNKTTGNKYYTSKNKLKGDDYNRLIQTAFETYSCPFLMDVRPERVLVLGKKLEDAIGRDMLQNVVESFGGTLLNTMVHPCYNKLFGDNAVSSLQTVRSHVDFSDGKKTVAIPKIALIPRKNALRKRKRGTSKSDNKENTVPHEVSEPVKKRQRQTRTSQRTALTSMHNTGKWKSFQDWWIPCEIVTTYDRM